jgi:hypothetical protein
VEEISKWDAAVKIITLSDVAKQKNFKKLNLQLIQKQ